MVTYIKEQIEKLMMNKKTTVGEMGKLYALLGDVYLFEAHYSVDSYLLRLEWHRDAEKKFYAPRRDALKPAVEGMQLLIDDELDILGISMPPGVGKSQLEIHFMTMVMGLHPNKPNLMSAHSDKLTRSFYDGINMILDDAVEYSWHEIFPNVPVESVSAKDETINLGDKNRFKTITCRSIDGTLTGATRCEGFLCADDLVSGIEEAMNITRMDSLWDKFVNDLRSRKKDRCKEIHVATRWSVHDPIGRLERLYDDNERVLFVSLPALDEHDESNFDYRYGVGFSTAYYHDMRRSMDEISWRCLYQNEPVEREGLLYHEEELRRYFDLPEGEPDAILSIADTKDTGKDYFFAPVAYVYGDDYYIDDCVCDNGVRGIPGRVAAMYIQHKVAQSRFESNSAGGKIGDEVQALVKTHGGSTHITKKFNTSNKETRIVIHSEWVKEHCLFRDKSTYHPGDEYGRMIKFLTSYTQLGKNKFDDVPDGMAQFAEFAQSFGIKRLQAVQNPLWAR